MISSADYHRALAALPVASFEALIGNRAVLVIAPHPDDESLGCGGLLAWAAANSRRAEVLFLTDGEASHPGSAVVPALQLGQIRMREAVDAAAQLGISSNSLSFLHLPDGSLPGMTDAGFAKLVEQVRTVLAKLGPCVVSVTAPTDPHGDHQKAYELAARAASELANCCVLAYPVWSWVMPAGRAVVEPKGYRVELGDLRAKKAGAIAAHASQHGRVVPDSSAAFVLPRLLLERLDQGFEVYLES